jgi:hypothetical protein
MIHSHQPPSFKASARLAPGPGFSEVHIVAVGARLRCNPSAAKIARPRLSLRLAINLDLNWQAFAHSLLLSIRKPGRRRSTTECPDVTEREQRGMNPAQPGVEIGAGA